MNTYNPKYYNKDLQREAIKWWATLSINEMKALENKYKTIYGIATNSEIAEIMELLMAAKILVL